MTDVFLEATLRTAGAILNRTPRGRKRRRPVDAPEARAAKEQALKESGAFSDRDVQILIEGNEIEERAAKEWGSGWRHLSVPDPIDRALRRTFSEAVDSAATSGALSMPSMSGWRAESDNVHVHGTHGTVRLHDGGTRWTHHAIGGKIVKSGTTQESLGAHLRGLVGDLGNAGAADANAEALDVVARIRARELGESPRPNLQTAKLVEAIRNREVGRLAPASHEALRSKMYDKLVTR